MRRVAIALAILGSSTSARAETVDTLVAEGEELAKRGQIGDAIAKFKEADRIEPRPIHSCLIALAYMRGGMHADAELMFARCHARATDPLPAWVGTEEAALASRIEKATLGTVALTLDPTIVELSVPALLSGEAFPARRTLRLAPGPHRIVGRTANGSEVVGEVTVIKGSSVTLTLRSEAPTVTPPLVTPPLVGPVAAPTGERSRVPTYLMLGGGATLVAGGLVHALAVRPARSDLNKAETGAVYDQHYDTFALRRNMTIGLYAAGGVALITGLVWASRSPEAPRVSAHVGDGGATVAVEWSR